MSTAEVMYRTKRYARVNINDEWFVPWEEKGLTFTEYGASCALFYFLNPRWSGVPSRNANRVLSEHRSDVLPLYPPLHSLVALPATDCQTYLQEMKQPPEGLADTLPFAQQLYV
jgi:hypothetical protein